MMKMTNFTRSSIPHYSTTGRNLGGWFAILLALTPLGIHAQSPAYLVKDILTTPAPSIPHDFVRVGEKVFFLADSLDGPALWRSDGTAANTVLIGVISPFGGGGPYGLTDVNGTLFFVDRDNLRRSDGNQVAQDPVLSGVLIDRLINVDGTLFFSTVDNTERPLVNQLWRSDGTAAGTMPLADVHVHQLLNLNGSLLFVGADFNGRELWRSDGTPGGTRRITDINPDGDSLPFVTLDDQPLLDVDGTVWFFASAGSGLDLWRSDGTVPGTQRVKALKLGDPHPPRMGRARELLFFVTESELWRSDGSEDGTFKLMDLAPNATGNLEASFVETNDSVFVFVRDTNVSGGLWRSDGTVAGTVPIGTFPGKDYVSSEPADNGDPTFLFTLFSFRFQTYELWRSDGTAPGTQPVSEIVPDILLGLGRRTRPQAQLQSAHGEWLFSNHGELWKSDGTESGTVPVKDLNEPANLSANPENLTDANGTLYFTTHDHDPSFWRSDGTEAGTMPLVPSGTFAGRISEPTNVAGTLYFHAENASSFAPQLWKSDGTPSGTELVRSFADVNDFGNVTALKRTLFFLVFPNSGSPRGFWRSNGSPEGTTQVTSNVVVTSGLTPVGDTLFFVGRDFSITTSRSVYGEELWNSDGTATGTVLVKDINPGGANSIASDILDVGGTAMFLADDGVTGVELWKSDGSAAGTRRVKDIVPGPSTPFFPEGVARVVALTAVDDRLFFLTVNASATARELWVSDGSEAGTQPLAAFDNLVSLFGFTAVDRTLFFLADGGQELWRSDGTAGGTVRLLRIDGGLGISNLRNVYGTLVFSADDALWRSDGTLAGTTHMVDNLDVSYPTVSGTRLFFAGSNSFAGAELWALPLAVLGCGNGTVDPGEDCDDGGESPSCNTDCTAVACGDGIVNGAAGEECDIGDPVDGGCCTADCTRQPIGTTCSEDSICDGIETCDALGRCQPGTPLNCDDGTTDTADFCDAVLGCHHAVICRGDCDANGTVAINELVVGVNMSLERAQPALCISFDGDGSATITVDELVTGVNHALKGCPR